MTSATHSPLPDHAAQRAATPRLSLPRIVEMNLGFFGLQFSFGLQQANMTPIYTFLGADEATMPLLWLAGPMTGLLIQPLVGALSDRIGRRPLNIFSVVFTAAFAFPYFLLLRTEQPVLVVLALVFDRTDTLDGWAAVPLRHRTP